MKLRSVQCESRPFDRVNALKSLLTVRSAVICRKPVSEATIAQFKRLGLISVVEMIHPFHRTRRFFRGGGRACRSHDR